MQKINVSVLFILCLIFGVFCLKYNGEIRWIYFSKSPEKNYLDNKLEIHKLASFCHDHFNQNLSIYIGYDNDPNCYRIKAVGLDKENFLDSHLWTKLKFNTEELNFALEYIGWDENDLNNYLNLLQPTNCLGVYHERGSLSNLKITCFKSIFCTSWSEEFYVILSGEMNSNDKMYWIKQRNFKYLDSNVYLEKIFPL